MIEGALGYVWAAYAVAGVGLVGLIVVTLARLQHWSRLAKALDDAKARAK
jgi:heme exporter protein D